jgi:dTDP-4-amino-4,6-dideoxygalactose transaminase
VHLFGLCADVDAIARVAPGIPIIEDAACAAGSAYRGRSAGSLGYAAAFSFHPRKSITTGEGGMVTTNDDALAAKVDMLRNHGASVSEEQRHRGPRPYLMAEFNLLGYNYRMTDLQGAVGLVQLEKLDRFIDERQRGAEFYWNELGNIEWLRLPSVPEHSRHGWQAFVCFVDQPRAPALRNELMERLQSAGISTRPGTHAVHALGYYRKCFGTHPDQCPAARDCDRQTMAIPLHNRMSPDDFRHVVASIKSV